MKRLSRCLAVLILWGVVMTLAQPLQARAVELDTDGKSAVLMDVLTGTVLYERNAHEPLAPASVTKVMTLLLIMEAIDSGKIGWEDMVTASESAAAKGGSQIYLKAGETMSVTDLVKSIAVSSANDAACAMAVYLAGSESAFVDMMNARAAELGMDDTHFVNCTGLDDGADAAQHRTSAYDIAVMSRQLLKYHPDIRKFTTIWMDTVRNGAFGLSNTNKLVRFYPGCTGLKTGYTSKAGYCLSASAQREELELIAVVMACQTSQSRTAACKAMLDYGFANYAVAQCAPEEALSVPVTLGTEERVTAVASGETALLIDKAKRSGITTRITLTESVAAPVAQGQELGSVTVLSGEEVLGEIPLVAERAVERKTWGDLILVLLRKIAMAAP